MLNSYWTSTVSSGFATGRKSLSGSADCSRMRCEVRQGACMEYNRNETAKSSSSMIAQHVYLCLVVWIRLGCLTHGAGFEHLLPYKTQVFLFVSDFWWCLVEHASNVITRMCNAGIWMCTVYAVFTVCRICTMYTSFQCIHCVQCIHCIICE